MSRPGTPAAIHASCLVDVGVAGRVGDWVGAPGRCSRKGCWVMGVAFFCWCGCIARLIDRWLWRLALQRLQGNCHAYCMLQAPPACRVSGSSRRRVLVGRHRHIATQSMAYSPGHCVCQWCCCTAFSNQCVLVSSVCGRGLVAVGGRRCFLCFDGVFACAHCTRLAS